MRFIKKHAKSASKRSLSFVLAVVVFVGIFSGTLGVLISMAKNPTHTGALNTYVPVQYIDLLPVEIGLTTYVDDKGNTVKSKYDDNGNLLEAVVSRTIYGDDSEEYLNVKVNGDNTVSYSMKQMKPASSTDTSYVNTVTQVNQLIDLSQNPFLMIAWESNVRANGSINFTVTRDGTTYYLNTKANTITKTTDSELTWDETTYRNSGFSFHQIYEKRYTSSADNNNHDFGMLNKADYTFDFYQYLYGYFKQNDWLDDYWPNWGTEGNYLKVNYVAHTMVSEKINTPLYDYSTLKWKTCALGRGTLNTQSLLTPRGDTTITYGDRNGNKNSNGKAARLDDGTYVFRNTSQTENAVFTWDVKRFLNVNELKALYLDASLTGTDSDVSWEIAIWGKNNTTSKSDHFTTQGYWANVSELIQNHSNQHDLSLKKKYSDVTINLYDEIQDYIKTTQYEFYPSDHLICIPRIELTLPPNAKLSIYKFGVRVENEFAPSTTTDTVYPWYSSEQVENLPPEGTPATSTALDSATGANSAAYNWAATETPIVENKVDLLSMTDQHVLYDANGQFTGFEKDDVTGYWRTLDGESHFTSTTSDLVYREFRRRDKSVTGPSDTRDNINYYIEIPVGTTPYLYYSYSLEGGDDKAVGFYFNVAEGPKTTDNNGSDHYYQHYYLGQSGLALQQCDAIMESTDETVGEAHRALCSSASERTGIIDLRSIGFKDSDIALIENMRFYVTGTSTEVTFNYLFFGSESLDKSVTSTIAKNSGDAFPWSITHDAFKLATLGTDSQFTFANRIDLIEDMYDRRKWNLKLIDSYIKSYGHYSDVDGNYTYTGSEKTDEQKLYYNNRLGSNHAYDEGDEYTSFGNDFVHNTDGSVTLDVNGSYRYNDAGTSFDHQMSFTIDKNSLSSLRYLNYSVEAMQGMRWAILFKESSNGTTPGVALRTWSDAMMSGDFYGSGSTNAADSKATVGKSYFRDMSLDVFHSNWYKSKTQSVSNALDSAWAMFTVPGSETGCFDLSQIQHNISWNDVISITFIAYKDPSLKTDDGKNSVNGSVTFNYLYLTSEPLKGSSFGAACLETGKSYSWGYVGDQGNVNFTGHPTTAFNSTAYTTDWGDKSGCTDYYVYSNKSSVLDFTGNHKKDYTLYYSFTFTKKGTNTVAYPKIMIGFFENGWTYKLRTRTGVSSSGNRIDFGSSELFDKAETELRGSYRMQMPESGAVKINDLGFDALNFVRVYYDVDNYDIHLEYLVVGFSSDCVLSEISPWGGYPSQPKKIEALGSKVADFSNSLYQIDNGITKIVEKEGGTTITAEKYSPTKNIVVDLNRTPYLFYSIKYASGSKGTFALGTDIAIDGLNGFFRDGKYSDIGSQKLLSPGIAPSSDNYLSQSETGCIDVRGWLFKKNLLPSDGKITITSFHSFLGKVTEESTASLSAHFYYMYFGAEADKTIDLIPKQAQSDLQSGVSTHSWAFDNSNVCGEMHIYDDDVKEEESDSEDEWWDDYINDSTYQNGKQVSVEPTVKATLPGDQNDDGYNDLRYSNTRWGFYSICYGEVDKLGSETTYKYVTTGNNQTSGLTINLNETPYLHFSITQPKGSYTTFLLQTNDYTGREVVRDLTAEKVKPWLSCYNSHSPAGQLMHISPQTSFITFYKDTTMTYDNGTWNTGDLAGVIDLRSWYTETNGYDDMISLERVRFYSTDQLGTYTDATVNHFYLSSSSGSAYSVMFDKNDGSETRKAIQVLKNANDQYVSDETVESFKTRDGYTFVGWYTDPEWENYFDIKKTPIRENLILYAGWIKNDEVVSGELNLLADADKKTGEDAKVHILSGNGEFEVDDEALHVRNTGDEDFVVKLDVNKAYSLYDSRSLYVGFDVAKSTQEAKVVLDLKSLGSYTYDILGEDFGKYFLTENNTLTAAPYNKQLPMYMTIAAKGLLPVKENENGYVYAKSLTFTVPVGEAMHFRYFTTAKAMSGSTGYVVAPSIEGTLLDLLDSKGDTGFVEQVRDATYESLGENKTEVYDRSEKLFQSHIGGSKVGYATLGSLYGLGNIIGTVNIDANDQQYLYYSIDQPVDSQTTFNIWVTVNYTEDNGQTIKKIHPPKWSSHFSAVDNKLHSQDDLIDGSIPNDAFIAGPLSGRINLYEWYSDALVGRSDVTSTAKVVSVSITGVRLYSSASGTDATFNYLVIGGDVKQADETMRAKAVTVNKDGETVENYISDVRFGQTVKISLDQLKDCADAVDPSKEFLGWSFSGNSASSLVYWNPNAENQKEYNATTNPKGFWSKTPVEGFVTNRRDISYQLVTDTQKIYPVFSQTNDVTLNVKFDGSGSVNVKVLPGVQHEKDVIAPIFNESISADETYTAKFGDYVLLSATSSDFVGWYGVNGQLLSDTRDYTASLYGDAIITAKFSESETVDLESHKTSHSHSIVWLQRADSSAGIAGKEDGFYLQSVHNGNIIVPSISHEGEEAQKYFFYSNIDDQTGVDEIACYWSIANGQLLEAVAEEGYHWEMLLQDGSTVCLGDSNTYRFVSSFDMKLICVPNSNSCSAKTGVMVNEYAVDFNRTVEKHTAKVSGQVLTADNEVIVDCGFVMAARPTGVMAPSFDSHESQKYSAQAWNSTTGQFVVSVDYTPGRAYYIRGYAIVMDIETNSYTLRYSDYVTISF